MSQDCVRSGELRLGWVGLGLVGSGWVGCLRFNSDTNYGSSADAAATPRDMGFPRTAGLPVGVQGACVRFFSRGF